MAICYNATMSYARPQVCNSRIAYIVRITSSSCICYISCQSIANYIIANKKKYLFCDNIKIGKQLFLLNRNIRNHIETKKREIDPDRYYYCVLLFNQGIRDTISLQGGIIEAVIDINNRSG